ncbi:MAG: mechanosensitive ion channel [Acidobacteriaceae bacterium]|nr:mechanosensitive ion channel [Acidobacteriaceae bacterium]
MSDESKMLSQLTTGKLLFTILMIGVAWLVLRWLRTLFNCLEHANPRLRFLARRVEPPLRILVWFIALLISLEVLAPSKDAFLAALGSAALAIALGAQDLIKNLIGGMVIVTDRPYQNGDLVKVGEASGEVEYIGLRSTKIITSDGVHVTVPNAEVLNRFTFNANGGVPECVATTALSVPHGADPELLLRVAREIAVSCPYTHLGHGIEVELDDSDPRLHTMKLNIRAYVYDHRYASAMQTDILRRCIFTRTKDDGNRQTDPHDGYWRRINRLGNSTRFPT